MELAGKRVLVTGGAGFIGSHLVDHLLGATVAREIRVLDNLANGTRENLASHADDPRCVLVEDDIRDRWVLGEALDGVDVVFHLACLGVRHSLHAPEENHAVNAGGTLGVLLAARRQEVERFVHVSSSEVFGTARAAPIDEEHTTWPHTVYGGSKLAGEAYARAMHDAHGMPTVVVRPFNTYGPRNHFEGDSGEVIPRSLVRVLCGLPPIVFGDGTQTRDFLHVTDTARALVDLACADEAVGYTVNVGFGEEISINDLCALVAEVADRPELAPTHTDGRPGDVHRLWVDNRLARELIGFAPTVTMQDGLADLKSWFDGHPLSPERMLELMPERNWQPGRESP